MSAKRSDTPRWWQRKSGRAVVELDVICVVITTVILTVPAIAAVAIPVPLTNYVINLGDAPPWIMAFVVAVTWWEARAARKHAEEAKVTAKEAVTIGKVVRAQTDGLLDKVAAMSKTAGKIEGHQEEVAQVAAAKEIVRTDAVADAKAAAEVRAADAPLTSAGTFGPGVALSSVEAIRPRPSNNQETPVTQTVNGKTVTQVRDAKAGDPSFDANKDQVIVRNADGSETTVLRTDVKTS